MKKYFFFFIFFLCIFLFDYYKVISKNKITVDNNSIIILKEDETVCLLIKNSDKFTLLSLNDINTNYKYFTNRLDNIIYKDKFKDTVIDDVVISNKGFININILDKNFCIYDKDLYKKNSNFNDCNYLYILNNTKKVYIDLNDDMNGLFYNEYSKFSEKFLEEMFITWIDTYVINDDEIIVIDFNSDYNINNYSLRKIKI